MSVFEPLTPRLHLMRPVAADLAAAIAIHTDPETYEHSPTGPMLDADVAPMLQLWLAHWKQHGHGFWAIRLRERNEVIGFGGAMPRPWFGRDEFILYYRFTPTAWGFGYATEMAREALVVAFTRLDAPQVVTKIRPSNLRSIAVAEKLGLERGDIFAEDGSPMQLYAIRNPGRRAP